MLASTEEFVLILDAANPKDKIKRLDINPNIAEYPLDYPVISWNPSGQQVILGQTVVRLSDGTACSLPKDSFRPYFFVGPDQIASFSVYTFRFFGTDCKPDGRWDTPCPEFFGVCPECGLVGMLQWASESWSQAERRWKPSSKEHPSIAVFDIHTRAMVRRLPGAGARREDQRSVFADSGKCQS